MPSLKRKAQDISLQRRIRARREPSETPELDLISATNDAKPTTISEDGNDSENNDEDGDEDNESDSSVPESNNNDALDAASISFGALAKVQASMSQPGKGKIRHAKSTKDSSWEDKEASERKEGRKDHRDFNRSSKHAPTEMSSKKAVSRKREVVPVIKRAYRDPRFDSLTGPVDESKFKAAYSFLDDYREDEMKELKTAIKATKDEEAKDKLKRALMSMESRKKAQLRKSKEQEILDRHRNEEKELVKQGKKPFYLKKAEQKKRVLLDTFGDLKGRQLDHVIERRRKKIESKEKKNMPFARRAVEG